MNNPIAKTKGSLLNKNKSILKIVNFTSCANFFMKKNYSLCFYNIHANFENRIHCHWRVSDKKACV